MDKVRTGQKFIPRAADWNSFIDAANYVRNRELIELESRRDGEPFSGIVRVKNITNKTFPIFSCLYMSDLSVLPEEDEENDEFFFSPIVFAVSNDPDPNIPSNSKVCILQEPLAPDQIGKAMAIGVTHGKVNIKDVNHCFARPTSSGGMVSAKKGPIQIIWWDGIDKGLQQCVLMV